MNRTDIECYRINYAVEGWREVAHRKGELCVPFAAVLAINALCDEVESLRKDAERYRWLREQEWIDDYVMQTYGIREHDPETVDVAIDAAMAKE